MIPKRIFQTWKTKEVPGIWKAYQQTWQEKHPEWEYCFVTDQNNRDFIAQTFPEFLQTYDKLTIPITKVDFVRYLYLYKFGGVYADLDCEALQPLDTLIEKFPNYGILVSSPIDSLQFVECACMLSAPSHPFWLDVAKSIQKAIDRPSLPLQLLKVFNRSLYILALTGPMRLGEVYREVKNRYRDIGLLPAKYFYPKKWTQQYIQSSNAIVEENKSADSYVVHHMSGSWISPRDKFFVSLFQKQNWWILFPALVAITLIIVFGLLCAYKKF